MTSYPAFKPSFGQNTSKALLDCIDQKSISGNFGDSLKNLELSYSLLHNNYHSVSCSNGTAALHLACLGLGINKSHTVVVPSITNMATFFAPMYCGAKVISCDVNSNDGLINLESLEYLCKIYDVDFVFIVHLYGHVVNPIKIEKLARKYNFKVIEDCAEAHFASFYNNSKYVGSYHDASCFSFYANKIITGGEGGITLFKSKEYSEKAKNLKNLGFGDHESPSKFFHSNIGYNYRLPNTVASLICDSLERKKEILYKRDLIRSFYEEAFEGKDYISCLYSQLSSYRVNWVYCIKINEDYLNKFKSKKELLNALSASGVEARDCFYPAELQPFYNNYLKENRYISPKNINSIKYYEGTIYLPVYLELSKEDIYNIRNIVESILLE